MSMGWMCPKCGAVYAPWVASCRNCKGKARPFAPDVPRHPPFPPSDGTGNPPPKSPYTYT